MPVGTTASEEVINAASSLASSRELFFPDWEEMSDIPILEEIVSAVEERAAGPIPFLYVDPLRAVQYTDGVPGSV